jgi:predicted SnoaL-like aldol condensation-catalyzing enzyme
MRFKNYKMSLLGGTTSALAVMGIMAATAQQPPALPAERSNPTPGCSVSKKQLEANRKLVMDFFRAQGAARVALADPSYKQHNPVFKKRAAEKGETDYDEFKSAFLNPPPRPPQTDPRPPAQSPFEIVTAECDMVTVVHKVYLQDPTASPGTFYESFRFDAFRVKDGKLVEHWDDATIMPPRQ